MNILTEPLKKAFNFLANTRSVPSDILTAHITVLPKPNKDTTECSSYGPISLLNMDLKLLAKILASKNPEQVAFRPGREAKDNIM